MNCGANAFCQNGINSYVCKCLDGYKMLESTCIRNGDEGKGVTVASVDAIEAKDEKNCKKFCNNENFSVK